jgi:predicted permease
MFQNHLKIALRSFLKNKAHSAINLLGLSFGLACTILIALWIQRELSMNRFHANIDRLFRVMEHQTYSDAIQTFSATPGPLVPALKEQFPEITHASRVSWGDRNLLALNNKSYFEEGLTVESDFMRMFSFPMLEGSDENALDKPGNILISSRLANKFFGEGQALGQTLRLDNSEDVTVAGIFANVPETSSLKFDFLLPYVSYEKNNDWLKNWGSNGIRTYFMTQPGITGEAITAKIKDVVKPHQDNVQLLAQPYADAYLRTDFKDGKYTGKGRIMTVKLFGIIALFLLAIACINFMNLATAKSLNRAKEVGVRKVTGATRGSLAMQFLTESVLMAAIAGLLGAGLASMALPFFNRLFELELSLNTAGNAFWLGMAGVTLLTGLIAGSYPALFLSGFQPMNVLKSGAFSSFKGAGGFGGGGAVRLRKVLVVSQFVIATALIISTLVIYKQLRYMKDVQLGYDREHLLYAFINGDLWDKYDAVKTELLQTPGIESVSSSNGSIHNWGNNTSNVSWQGKDPEKSILFQTIPVGYDFVKTIGATLRDGRDFSPDFPNDTSAYLINETAAEMMGLKNPVGENLTLWGATGPIVGWVKDFHVGGMHAEQDPVIMILRPWKNYFYVRLAAQNDVAATLSAMERIFKKYNPAYPFEYRFCDQEFQDMHRSDLVLGELAKLFAFLTIFVSCLGLFGLAAFATAQRTKEIGIRKVLGASVSGIVGLLSKDFLKLVVISFVIAAPVAWYFMQKWLSDFAHRIDIQWTMFALAGVGALLVAFLTVSFQSVKAALANPVKSLRSE